jgi:hypothetical protein
LSTALAKAKAKRARRPIYMRVCRLVDPETGEQVGALVPMHPIDQRLMRERKFHVDREVRAELKQPRNPQFHRLAHAIGNLLVDNVEKFSGKQSHEALKIVQAESGACCDVEKIVLDLGTLGRHEIERAVPRSLAFDELEEDEFRTFFDGIVAYIGEHYTGVMLDDVREEFWSMVQGEQQ